ncbi:MAG TPA: L,D-transpeptidase family protein, partial [Saprospiraceae bacterium]|nr:L,D-transpeptidase family protein [Saprospiraceae bacterium]
TPDNTLLDIARHFDVGYEEMVAANPGASVWTPGASARVVVPTRYLLPPKPWRGIVVNVSQRRLFYFPPVRKGQRAEVVTYPVGIAREGWSTPLGETRLTAKYKDPAWFVPKSIQEEHRQESGEAMPEYFPPGPDNPMGMLALKTGFPSIFIHATNRPWGVGMRVSHGCLHLYPEDAAEIFPSIPIGTPVRFIDEPFVIGVDASQRWHMTSYGPLTEYPYGGGRLSRAIAALQPLLQQMAAPTAAGQPDIDWNRVAWLSRQQTSVPYPIQVGMPGMAELLGQVEVERYEYEPYGIDSNTAALPEYEPGKTASPAAALPPEPENTPEMQKTTIKKEPPH